MVEEGHFFTKQIKYMVYSGRLINLKTLLNNNLEALDREEILNAMNVDSEKFEDELFIGSVFCSDLSDSQKVLVGNQQNQDFDVLTDRFGMVTNHEQRK